MDDESGEFMERAKLVCVGRSESKMERPEGVDSRDKVRHSKKTGAVKWQEHWSLLQEWCAIHCSITNSC